jgi:predicted RNA binding protein YcfA (HicA-like mRNA interferase family)
MPMKARDAIRRLKREGWQEVRQVGSHKQFRHPTKPELITVPDHPGDLKPGTERDIRRKAGW